jgi:hypothetical protein
MITCGLTLIFFHLWNMYCFIDSVCDDKFGAAYGPAGGGVQDHFWGVIPHMAGTNVERT